MLTKSYYKILEEDDVLEKFIEYLDSIIQMIGIHSSQNKSNR